MAADCIKIMLKFIKENWLTGVIAGAVGSIITIVIINHWYSKNVSDVITNWITAVSSLSVAVFAWMAYKYATQQYMKNEIEKITWEKKYKVILLMLRRLRKIDGNISSNMYSINKLLKKVRNHLSATHFEPDEVNHMLDIVTDILKSFHRFRSKQKYSFIDIGEATDRLNILKIPAEDLDRHIKALDTFFKTELKYNSVMYELKDIGYIIQENQEEIQVIYDMLRNFRRKIKRIKKKITTTSNLIRDTGEIILSVDSYGSNTTQDPAIHQMGGK